MIQRIDKGGRHLINRLRRAFEGGYRRRFVLHLTVEGWCLVVTMMLIGLAALNTAAPLLYLMFSMMCSFFILSALLATNTMRGVSVSRRVPRVWQAQVPLRVPIEVRNKKLVTASYSLRVNDISSDGEVVGAAFFDQIPPRSSNVRQEYECVFRRRGVYGLDRLTIATRFPFGLIERMLSFQDQTEILVLPQTISLGHSLEQARSDLGDFQSQKKGQGSGLYGLRSYSPEFPARDIHWKISARRGQLILREYESEERRRAIVTLDNRVSPAEQAAMEHIFEKAVVLATTVIEWLCQTQHEVEFRTASGIVGFATGQGHFTRCRRCLARLEMIPPDEGDPHLLFGGEEGVVVFPILLRGSETTTPFRFPVSVDEFDRELEASFQSHDRAENRKSAPLLQRGEAVKA